METMMKLYTRKTPWPLGLWAALNRLHLISLRVCLGRVCLLLGTVLLGGLNALTAPIWWWSAAAAALPFQGTSGCTDADFTQEATSPAQRQPNEHNHD